MNENKFMTVDPGTGPIEAAIKPLPFKDPSFIHSGIGGAAAGKKNRTWKNLKQILASERALPWQLNDPSYFSIDAPPSFKPAKKYSDISGLPANYTDPQSKLRFSSIEEFAYIRMLPSDVVTGYLALRKATKSGSSWSPHRRVSTESKKQGDMVRCCLCLQICKGEHLLFFNRPQI
uniref:INO80 complex subunit C n=1 Tax=Pelodiscus sinensis TaxID=13735 RepID=K7FTV7_PELSI